jgi:hypothetical protein
MIDCTQGNQPQVQQFDLPEWDEPNERPGRRSGVAFCGRDELDTAQGGSDAK